MEDNEEPSESFDQLKIDNLKREVTISKSELLELAYNDQKFMIKLQHLNSLGYEAISKQEFHEAVVFLAEAQNALEYAAQCGKTIERSLIITTLHNEACVYQRMWELSKSADYIEAIIYNITSFLSAEGPIEFSKEVNNKNSTLYHKVCNHMSNKLQLITYNLQFCAVSSQIKNHENALSSAQKALNLLKEYCQELHAYQKYIAYNVFSDFERVLLLELQNIRNFQEETNQEIEKNIEKLIYKAKKSIVVFQKKMKFTGIPLLKSELIELQNFSLGQLMQVGPIKEVEIKVDLSSELSFCKKIYKAIYISIAHFTMATELRLIANEKHGFEANYKKFSKEFKESQVHHLVAIITAALYVPCYTKYFQHILNSFKNHYQIDLTQISEISLSQDGSHPLEDDLIHLQTQSVSQRQTTDRGEENDSYKGKKVKNVIKDSIKIIESAKNQINSLNDISRHHTQPFSNSFHRDGYSFKTYQQSNTINSGLSSENEHLKSLKLNKSKDEVKKNSSKSKKGDFKKKNSSKSQKRDKLKFGSSNPKVSIESTEDQKRLIIMQKMTSKSRGKIKQNSTKRSHSKKSNGTNNESKQKIIHYFQYDNYSKKVIKKKVKDVQQQGEYELKKIISKPLKFDKDKKMNQAIKQVTKKTHPLTQATREMLVNADNISKALLKKTKSPDESSRSQKYLKKIS